MIIVVSSSVVKMWSSSASVFCSVLLVWNPCWVSRGQLSRWWGAEEQVWICSFTDKMRRCLNTYSFISRFISSYFNSILVKLCMFTMVCVHFHLLTCTLCTYFTFKNCYWSGFSGSLITRYWFVILRVLCLLQHIGCMYFVCDFSMCESEGLHSWCWPFPGLWQNLSWV